MKRQLINIKGIKHAVEYSCDTGDPIEDRVWPNENICCTYFKQTEFLWVPQLGITRANLNYCPVCGSEIVR